MTRSLGKRDLLTLSRNRGSHKGENGCALVIGGSSRYIGAPYLAAMAALRTGLDKVTIAAPEKVAWSINSLSPDLITVKLPGDKISSTHLAALNHMIQDADAFLIGNGMDKHHSTVKLIDGILRSNAEKPKVIDADAIACIKPDLVKRLRNSIITPHGREYAILKENLDGKLDRLAANNVILKKGPIDGIIGFGKSVQNKTGNAMMATAGTGDVLAGLALGFCSQSKDIFRSAATAAYVNGVIGDLLYERQGTFTASDLIPEISLACKDQLSIRFL